MSKSFIYDNFACQKGKGPDAARERLKEFLRRAYRRYGSNTFYVAQFDIHKYYASINHSIAKTKFKKKLDPGIYMMVETILDSQYEGYTGYDPGSQIVQIAGISILDELDHYVKEVLRIKEYIRYNDDFILIHNDREYLEFCQTKIIEKLEAIKLEVNPKKTRIYPVTEGIGFLGFNFRITETGKVLMFIKPEKVQGERKKLYRMVKKSLVGEIPKESVDASYEGWCHHASKGDSNKLLYNMDKYYENLWNNPSLINSPGKNEQTFHA